MPSINSASIQALVCFVTIASFATVSAGAQEAVSAGLRKYALELVNKERTSRHLAPLRLEAKLIRAAQSHADDMLRRNFYSHNSPEGKTVSDRYQAAGGNRWLLTAENIAKCTGCKSPVDENYIRQMHKGWMESPGHRANILRKGLTEFGYGWLSDRKINSMPYRPFPARERPRAMMPVPVKSCSRRKRNYRQRLRRSTGSEQHRANPR